MNAVEQQNPDAGRTWFLTPEEYAATSAKLAKLQRRAERKGFTGRVTLTGKPATRQYRTPGGLPITQHGFDVTIRGEPPSYEGWRFVAAVDAVDGGIILRSPPGSTTSIPTDHIRAGACDHCHTKRTRRSTVLVAHEETGQLLQVGRACVKDFLGHNTFPVFLTEDELRNTLRTGGTPPAATWDVDTVLAYAAAAVEAFGWTPSSAHDPGCVPTRDRVRLALVGGRGADLLRTSLEPFLADAQEHAPHIRDELIAGLDGTSGYEANLLAVLRAASVDARHLGLAVSAITAHQRLTTQRHQQQARRVASGAVEYAGTVGEKLTMSGTVRTAMRVEGYTYHSPASALLVVDCGTAVAKMVTAAGWAYAVKVGDQLTVTGTVKQHADYNGTKQTVLTRPKRVDPSPHAHPDQPTAGWETIPSRPARGVAPVRPTTVRTPTRGVPHTP